MLMVVMERLEWRRFNRMPGLRKVLAEKGFTEQIFRNRVNEPIERWHPLVFRRITNKAGEAETRHFLMVHSPKGQRRTIVPFVLIGGLDDSLRVLHEAFPGAMLTHATGGFIRAGLRPFQDDIGLLDLEPKRRLLPHVEAMEIIASAFAGLARVDLVRKAADALEASRSLDDATCLDDGNAFKKGLLERQRELHAIVIKGIRYLKGEAGLEKAVRLLETRD